MLPTYKEGAICYKEYFKVLFLNQAKQVLGYTLISEGGITETCADVRGWATNPVSSHLIARMELITGRDVEPDRMKGEGEQEL